MAISVNWITGVISIPRVDMTLIQSVPTEIRQLNVMEFKEELGAIKTTEDGRPWSKPFKHNKDEEVEGVVLADLFKILDPYTVTFENGLYGVNLVAANNNIRSKTNRNLVSIASSNSAGLLNLDTLLSGAYQGEVVINVARGQRGTSAPIGTLGKPSNNIEHTLIIADNENAKEINLQGSLTLVDGDDVSYRIFVGSHPLVSSLAVEAESNTIGLICKNLQFSGALDGGAILEDCVLGEVRYFSGYINHCVLTIATIFMNGAGLIYDSKTGSNASIPSPIDLTNATSLVVQGQEGHIKFVNCENDIKVEATMTGKLTIDSSVTAGEFHIYGDCEVSHTQSGTEVVIDKTTGSPQEIAVTVAKETLVKYQNKAVYIDTESLVNGDGSALTPFNNVADTTDFAEANGIKTVYIYSEVTIDRNVKNFTCIGVGAPVVNCNAKDLKNTEFYGCELRGTYTDRIKAKDCILGNNFELNGNFKNCGIASSLTCIDGGNVTMYKCFASNGGATISLNGEGSSTVSILDFENDLTFTDINNVLDEVKVSMKADRLTIDDTTCTAGTIEISGNPLIAGGSNGVTLTIDALTSRQNADATFTKFDTTDI